MLGFLAGSLLSSLADPCLQVDVPKNVLSLWDRDESLCLRAGRYMSQLVAYGSARRWSYPELHVLKDVLVKHGWWASTVHSVRGLGKRGYRKVKATDWRYFYRVGEPRKNRNLKKKLAAQKIQAEAGIKTGGSP